MMSLPIVVPPVGTQTAIINPPRGCTGLRAGGAPTPIEPADYRKNPWI
jgi:hypothetical protein